MLDRKTKDVDASIEILDDRKNMFRLMCHIFFIIGWTVVFVSAVLIPYKYDEIGLGLGITVLIFSTWFYIDMNYYNTLIMMKKLHELEK